MVAERLRAILCANQKRPQRWTRDASPEGNSRRNSGHPRTRAPLTRLALLIRPLWPLGPLNIPTPLFNLASAVGRGVKEKKRNSEGRVKKKERKPNPFSPSPPPSPPSLAPEIPPPSTALAGAQTARKVRGVRECVWSELSGGLAGGRAGGHRERGGFFRALPEASHLKPARRGSVERHLTERHHTELNDSIAVLARVRSSQLLRK